MENILLSAEMMLAIDDAKKNGNIDAIRNTANYRETLASMDKEPGRTHEQNVEALDELCRQAVRNTPALVPEMREVLKRQSFKG